MFNPSFRKGMSVTPQVFRNITEEKMAAPNNAYYVLTQAHAGLPNSVLFDAVFGTKTTDNLAEGSSNLYYTDARVAAYVSPLYVPYTGANANVDLGGNAISAGGVLSDIYCASSGTTLFYWAGGEIGVWRNMNLGSNNLTATEIKSNTWKSNDGATSLFEWDGGEINVLKNLYLGSKNLYCGDGQMIRTFTSQILSLSSDSLFFWDAINSEIDVGQNMNLGSYNLTTTGKGTLGGANNTNQLIVKANSSQTATTAVIAMQNSSGTELFGIRTNPALYGYSAGLYWVGGSRLIEQRSSPEGADRMLYAPHGDVFEVLNEAGNAFMFGVYGNNAYANAKSVISYFDFVIGSGYTGIDYKLTFNGETNDGVITWMEDEDYFKFSDDIYMNSGENIVLSTTTGTKIGTSTNQKLSFYNSTPIIQPTTGVAEAAFVENAGGTAVNVDSTFGGYTLQQVVKALQNLGLLA